MSHLISPKENSAIKWQMAALHQWAISLVGFLFMIYYSNHVCEYFHELSIIRTSLLIGVPLTLIMLVRTWFIKWVFNTLLVTFNSRKRSYYMHVFDLTIWAVVALLLSTYNTTVLIFPIGSGLKILIGYLCIGLFSTVILGLDIAYNRVHLHDRSSDVQKSRRYISLSKRLQYFVFYSSTCIMILLILLMRQSLTTSEKIDIHSGYSLLHNHILFIFSSYFIAIFIITKRYGRNMVYLLEKQLSAFRGLLNENYKVVVPLISNDEIGRIASATNALASKLEGKRLLVRELQKQAIMDPLTKAFNRRYLEIKLSDKYENDWLDQTVSIIAIDIDHFKSINDRHGHDCGDLILIHTVEIIKKQVRANDAVIRAGGEEFWVILASCNETQSTQIAEKIRAAIENSPIEYNSDTVHYTASFGIGTAVTSKTTLQALITEADEALYKAKRSGRNCVVTAQDRH